MDVNISVEVLKDSKDIVRDLLKEPKLKELITKLRAYHTESYIHSLKVGLLAVLMGFKNDYSFEDIQTLGRAGLLHDIGKLNVPKEILEKPTKLNEEETFVMEGHPVEGMKILRDLNDQKVKKVVVAHHEFCERAYPKKNSFHKVKSIFNRDERELRYREFQEILSVCDVYEALKAERAYKTAFDTQKIKKIINKECKVRKKFRDQVMKVGEIMDN